MKEKLPFHALRGGTNFLGGPLAMGIAAWLIPVMLSGISVIIFCWELNTGQRLDSVFITNRVTLEQQITIAILCIGAVLSIGGVSYYCCLRMKNSDRWSARNRSLLRSLLWFMSSLWLLPLLTNHAVWEESPILCFILLGVFAWVAHRFIVNICADLSNKASPSTVNHTLRLTCHVLIAAAAVSYFLYFSYWSVIRHYKLQTMVFDLGILQNAILNTSLGNFMGSSFIESGSFP